MNLHLVFTSNTNRTTADPLTQKSMPFGLKIDALSIFIGQNWHYSNFILLPLKLLFQKVLDLFFIGHWWGWQTFHYYTYCTFFLSVSQCTLWCTWIAPFVNQPSVTKWRPHSSMAQFMNQELSHMRIMHLSTTSFINCPFMNFVAFFQCLSIKA